jgi:hypothetical protein
MHVFADGDAYKCEIKYCSLINKLYCYCTVLVYIYIEKIMASFFSLIAVNLFYDNLLSTFFLLLCCGLIEMFSV